MTLQREDALLHLPQLLLLLGCPLVADSDAADDGTVLDQDQGRALRRSEHDRIPHRHALAVREDHALRRFVELLERSHLGRVSRRISHVFHVEQMIRQDGRCAGYFLVQLDVDAPCGGTS